MSKLNKEELLGQVDTWLICCKHDGIKVYGSCKKCPCEKVCKQAEQQIKEMIQKPQVTKEWIEEKANQLQKLLQSKTTLAYKGVEKFYFSYQALESFIRSLVEEIQ